MARKKASKKSATKKKSAPARPAASASAVAVAEPQVSGRGGEGRYEIDIALIGGGSRAWARMLFRDLALTPQLTGRIHLYDVDHAAAQRNVKVADDIFGHPDAVTRFEVKAVKDLGKALKGADFVVISIQPGPMQMFANDIDIPARYGILHAVGDTTGPAGISRALRAIPIFEHYAEQIAMHCPDAWVINYTNPMTLCTATLHRVAPGIKAFGCCHEVFGTQQRLARLLSERLEVAQPPRQQVRVEVSGVNHFTFVTEARWKDHDLLELLTDHLIARDDLFVDRTDFALESKKLGRWFSHCWLIALDFFVQFGALGAAGDRHLAEFVPWYLESEEILHRWGVVLTPSSYRLGMWEAADRKVAAQQKQKAAGDERAIPLKRSDEEGIEMILALLGDGPLLTNVNLPNEGQAPDLPRGAVVETNAAFTRGNLRPLVTNELPGMLSGLVRRVIDVQQVTLEAGLSRDLDTAFEALLADPLTRIPTDKAWDMFCEMVQVNAALMKEYTSEQT